MVDYLIDRGEDVPATPEEVQEAGCHDGDLGKMLPETHTELTRLNDRLTIIAHQILFLSLTEEEEIQLLKEFMLKVDKYWSVIFPAVQDNESIIMNLYDTLDGYLGY